MKDSQALHLARFMETLVGVLIMEPSVKADDKATLVKTMEAFAQSSGLVRRHMTYHLPDAPHWAAHHGEDPP